jgi:hypothetical protein
MDIETTAKTIQLIIAPAVMVTACGVLLTGMIGHYEAINDRIRSLAAERLDLALLVPFAGHEHRAEERLGEIDHQLPMLLHRHQQVHNAILLSYGAVTVLVASMFVIAAAALAHSSILGTVALFVLLGGTAALLAGGWFMATEIRRSHTSVAFEAARVSALPTTWFASGSREMSPGPYTRS